MDVLFRVLLFISSYIPLFILVFINNINAKVVKDRGIINAAKELFYKNKNIWMVLLILSLLSLISIWILFKDDGTANRQEEFKNVRSINTDILDYFITYIIPLLTFEIENPISIIVNFSIFIIIGIYYVEGNLIYLNIIFIFKRYKVYKDDSNRIIISRRSEDFFKKNPIPKRIKVGENIYIVN